MRYLQGNSRRHSARMDSVSVSGTAYFAGFGGVWVQRGAFVCVGAYDVLDKFD
jgi:hypothetical protein